MQRVIKTSRYEATLNPSGKTMFIVILNTDVNTDAVLGLGPTPDERLPTRDEDGLVNFFEDADDEADHQWREKLGKFLYDFVVKPDMRQQGIRGTSFAVFSMCSLLTIIKPLPDRTHYYWPTFPAITPL